jgi:hypothetical protein
MKKDKVIRLIKEELVDVIKEDTSRAAVGKKIVASEWHNNLLIEKHANGYITVQVGGRSNSMLNLGKGQDFKTLMKILVDVSRRK